MTPGRGHLLAGAVTDVKIFMVILFPLTSTLVVQLDTGHLVSGSCDKSLCIWDVEAAECCQKLLGHEHEVMCLCQLPDGRLVSGSEDFTLRAWPPPAQLRPGPAVPPVPTRLL